MTSSNFTCLVLPHADADGPANMARDEAMLEQAAASTQHVLLRTYGWTEPTLSLGYFQSIADVEANDRWRNVPVVRRPTGGGAIWHDREITYALAVPRAHPLTRQSGPLYRAVHGAIVALLDELNASAERRGEERAADPSAPKPFLCFLDRDAEDLVIGEAKIVGSAQRRRAGTVLQHGSILLARSPQTPELAGVRELVFGLHEVEWWSDRLAQRLPAALGLPASRAEWSDVLLDRAEVLAETVYRNPTWTRRR